MAAWDLIRSPSTFKKIVESLTIHMVFDSMWHVALREPLREPYCRQMGWKSTAGHADGPRHTHLVYHIYHIRD